MNRADAEAHDQWLNERPDSDAPSRLEVLREEWEAERDDIADVKGHLAWLDSLRESGDVA